MIGAQNRRTVMRGSAGAIVSGLAPGQENKPVEPWYRRARRWGRTNITEKDPVRYDIGWWREYFKRIQIEGVIIIAGGIVAYYPSRYSPASPRGVLLSKREYVL
jgi:hypothetical protein